MTLAELLISSLITIAITAAVLGLADPAQHAFQAQPEASDVQQRLRVGVDSIQKDLILAGAGT
jgi:Tfp pilus assembly protein PilW